MPVEYIGFEEAQRTKGLRMVVVSGVPSPWGEAAKGILHMKGIPWKAVRLDVADPAMAAWIGGRSGPVVMFEDEAPRAGWAEILLLAERLAPKPALLPSDTEQRVLAMGLAHEICGEMGLGWCRRNQAVDDGLHERGGFPKPIAAYLGPKYGYRAEETRTYAERVIAILGSLSARLKAQRDAGSRFYLGHAPTAVDLYSATCMALFAPLPHAQCAMREELRAAFSSRDEATTAALDPILLEHRDFIYAEYLELPLSL
jgi:glutathione S-transferase